MMLTCPYCATEVQKISKGFYCSFCQMTGMTPTQNGERRSRYKMKDMITTDDLKKTTPELMTYHTFDLKLILKMLREQKRDFFTHITTFKRAGNETDEFREIEKETGDEYEKIKRKTWAVENILMDRVGYIPIKVSQDLLMSDLERIEKTTGKQMNIKKSETQKKATQ